MGPEFLEPNGEVIPTGKLATARGRELADALSAGQIEFASFVECRSASEQDIIVLDVEVELPQLKVNPIERVERVSVEFCHDDRTYPEVLALRSDFPRVPHLNLRKSEKPRSLCLYSEPYSEIKLRWTPAQFIEDIRGWLRLTAKGKLHRNDQPLEQFFLGSCADIIIPDDLLKGDSGDLPEKLQVGFHNDGPRPVFVAERPSAHTNVKAPKFVATVVQCFPQQHGIIHQTPSNLFELHKVLQDTGFDLISTLRTRFQTWRNVQKIHEAGVILLLVLPLTRESGGPIEVRDVWAFGIPMKVSEVGEAIDAWQLIEGVPGRALVSDTSKMGQGVKLDMLNPRYALTRNMAATLNDLATADSQKVAAVGLGALGSQVFLNLLRAGFGQWTLIDNDRLLPHNVARHALPYCAVGQPKASALSQFSAGIFDGEEPVDFVVADVMQPGDKRDEVEKALADAEIILDMSASVSAARYLALDASSSARRVSVFLSPTGRDLVVLAEDTQRKIRLDLLEMQFYRELANNPALKGYFSSDSDTLRYGRSCSDVTSTMPQRLLALHSGIAAHAVLGLARTDSASISVWRTNPERMSVEAIPVPVFEASLDDGQNWRLSIDEATIQKLGEWRQKALPNETGGVLIGSFDLQHRNAYVVDALPSPPDSEEWPTHYIRGSRQLKAQVEIVVSKTHGGLDYVGEWHSHPDGCGVRPSQEDLQVFGWLTTWMGRAGLPALLMIVGEGQSIGKCLGEVLPAE